MIVLCILVGLLAQTTSVSATGSSVTLTASASTVSPGATVDLTAGMPVSGSGTVTQEIVQEIDPTKVKLTSVSDITYPVGWTLGYCSGASTDCSVTSNFTSTTPANASAWAGVKAVKANGSIVSEGSSGSGKQIAARLSSGVLSEAGGSLTAPTGQDGWDVFFDPGYTRIFTRPHHKYGADGQLILMCYWLFADSSRPVSEQSAGSKCGGRALYLNDITNGFVSSDRSTGWIDSQNRLWLETQKTKDPGRGYGFACFDVSGSTPTPCAVGLWHRLEARTSFITNYNDVMDLAVFGGKIFTTTVTGNLLCLDTALTIPAACAGQPYALAGIPSDPAGVGGLTGDVKVIGSKVVLLKSSSRTAGAAICIDPSRIVSGASATSIQCQGWPLSPPQVGGGPLIAAPNALGQQIAVCGVYNSVCLSIDSGTTNVSGLPSDTQAMLRQYNKGALASFRAFGNSQTIGTRIYWTSKIDLTENIMCFDAVANGICSGWPVAETTVYSVRSDPVNPSCVWTNADTGYVRIRDGISGSVGCTSTSPIVKFPANVAVPRMACGANAGIQEWVDFRLPLSGADSLVGKFTAAKLSVVDPGGTIVPGWDSVVIPADGVLSLSTLPVSGGSGGGAWVAGSLEFRVTFENPSYTSAPKATIKAIGDAPQLCLRPTTIVACPSGSGPVSGLIGGTSLVTARGSSSGGGSATTLDPASITLTISAPTSSQCGATLSGRAGDGSLGTTGTAISGVTVTLLDSSGNPVLSGGSPVTTTTDSSGNYSFGYLYPGSYKVSFPTLGAKTVSSATTVSGATGTTTGTTTAASGVARSNVAAVAVGTNAVVNGLYSLPIAATNDTSSGAQGAAQTISVLANDTPGTGRTLTVSAVKLCGAAEVSPNCTLGSASAGLVVSGQGKYTVNASGVVTFTPCSGVGTPTMTPACTGAFTGQATAVQYQITDGANTTSATITPSVAAAPSAVADAQTGPFDTNQVYDPATNDTAGSGTTVSASSVRLCVTSATSPYTSSNCTATTVTTADGVYTLDTSMGQVTFDPAATFIGVATVPIRYVVADALGQYSSSSITPTVTAPAADVPVGDVSAGVSGAAQSVDLLANDTTPTGVTLTASSTRLCAPGTNAPQCTSSSVDVPNVGTYTLVGSTVTFVPCTATLTSNCTSGTAFSGSAEPPLGYQVTDSLGRVVSSTYTPSVVGLPTPNPDAQTGPFDTNQTYTPSSNDTPDPLTTMAPATVRLCPTSATAPYTSSNCSATSVTTADGTYTVDTATGTVTFDPLPTFTGTATIPIHYVVSDALGQTSSSTITPTVTPPAPSSATANTTSGPVGVAQSVDLLANDSTPAGVTLTASSTHLCSIGESSPSCTATTVDVPNVGSYSLSVGTVTFTPCTTTLTANCTSGSAFIGTPAPIGYQVTDSIGRVVSSTYTPAVVPPPTTVPDAQTGAFDTDQTYTPIANDTPGSAGGAAALLSATSVRICTVATADGSCTGTADVTISGQGVWSLDPATGVVTFDPDPAFTGPASPIKYCVTDSLGQTACSTISPTVAPPPPDVPIADTSAGVVGAPQTRDLLANDATPTGVTIDPSTARLCPSGASAPSCAATSVDIANVGTYTLVAGTVTFTPCTTTRTAVCTTGTAFTGTPAPLGYQVTDSIGRTISSTYTPTVVPPPIAAPDGAQGVQGATQRVTLLSNDTAGSTVAPLDPSTIGLCAPGETPPNCHHATVHVAGQGDYTLTATGLVEFVPDPAFVGTATALRYQVTDVLGQTTDSTITPRVVPPPAPITVDDTVTGPADTPMTIDPLANDSPGTIPTGQSGSVGFDRPTLRLCAPRELAPNCTATSLTTADGTYTVDTRTGFVTFIPGSGFVGQATQPVTYQIANDWTGLTGCGITTGIITVVIDPAAPSAPVPAPPTDQRAGTSDLPVTGFDTAGLVAWAATLLIFGGAVVRLTAVADDRRSRR